MTTEIKHLVAIAAFLLNAEEQLLSAGIYEQAEITRGVADFVLQHTRSHILNALALPANAIDRFALLKAAVDVDGVGSALAASVAQALAGEAALAAA